MSDTDFILPPAITPTPVPPPEHYTKDFGIYENANGKNKKIGYDYYAAAVHLINEYHIKNIEGKFMFYDDHVGIYKPTGENFENLSRLIERMDHSLNKKSKSEICLKMQDLALDKSNSPLPYSHKIVFSNGTYDPETNSFGPHSPDDNCTIMIPHIYKPDAYCKAVDDELDLLTNNNIEDRRYLEQILFGYVIGYGYNDMKKFVVILGPPNSGKSRMIAMSQDMLGRTDGIPNYSTLQIGDLSKNFKLHSLIGKAANYDADVDLDFKNEKTVSLLKMITGDDRVSTEQKYQDGKDGVSLVSKFILAANDRFTFSNIKGAISERMLVFLSEAHFDSFADPNKHLLREIKTEEAYEYMVKIGLIRLMDIRKNGFCVPSKSQQAKINFIKFNEPLREFLESIANIDTEFIGHTLNETYTTYIEWVNDMGIRHPDGKRDFRMEIQRLLNLTLKRIGPADNRGPAIWQYLNPSSKINEKIPEDSGKIEYDLSGVSF